MIGKGSRTRVCACVGACAHYRTLELGRIDLLHRSEANSEFNIHFNIKCCPLRTLSEEGQGGLSELPPYALRNFVYKAVVDSEDQLTVAKLGSIANLGVNLVHEPTQVVGACPLKNCIERLPLGLRLLRQMANQTVSLLLYPANLREWDIGERRIVQSSRLCQGQKPKDAI